MKNQFFVCFEQKNICFRYFRRTNSIVKYLILEMLPFGYPDTRFETYPNSILRNS